jgi:ATP-dependent RNA helicase RhlE
MKLQTSVLRLNSFKEMAFSPVLYKALEKMQIKKPTEVQAQAIPLGLNGADLVAVAQTGSGKTLAFALPVLTALEKKPEARALILAPSREMAQQIQKVFIALCEELPLTTAIIIGGTPSAKQISQLKKNPRLIIATPGRLNDHLIGNKLLLQNVEYLVIDEADRMLDMGFAPQLKNIQNTLRGQRQTLMFSASFGQHVEDIAQLFMSSKAYMIRSAQAESPVTALKQRVLFIDKFKKNDRLLDELNATKGGVIVFTGNQGSCERMGQYLKDYGYDTDLIHGGLSQGHRNRVIRNFRDGQIRVLVATDLIARGIDVPHVDHVINFDLPFQSEDFLHRIGRTARAGRSGTAITFVTSSDTKMYNRIKPYLQGAKEETVDADFAFTERTERPTRRKDHNRVFNLTQKTQSKPESKTISRVAKPNKHSEKMEAKKIGKAARTGKPSRPGKPRNDKFKPKPKPSTWKK